MENPIKDFTDLMTARDLVYFESYMKGVYEKLLGPTEQSSRAETVKKEEARAAYNTYSKFPPVCFEGKQCQLQNNQFESKWEEVNPYITCKVEYLRALKATQREAVTGAETLAPYFIELLQSDPTLLNRISLQLWFGQLRNYSGTESNFSQFSNHVTREIGVFNSIRLHVVLQSYLGKIDSNLKLRMASYRSHQSISINCSTCNCGQDSKLERDFYESLALEYPSELERLHTFLFRRELFEELGFAMSNFKVYK